MKQTLNILSIDFDFFQIVDKETLHKCYPDGHDLSTELSKMVWAGYYANPNTKDKLNAVKLNVDALNELQSLINLCDKNTPVLVTNSHKHIYNFIKSHDKNTELTTKLKITNIDMHHDMFDNFEEVDCGNWLLRLSNEYPTDITWVANAISNDMYPMDETNMFHIQQDFSNINPTDIDLIFLCRSDIWLPPHLDVYFNELIKLLCKRFVDVKGENSILSPRNMSELIATQEQFYKNIKGEIHGKNNQNMERPV